MDNQHLKFLRDTKVAIFLSDSFIAPVGIPTHETLLIWKFGIMVQTRKRTLAPFNTPLLLHKYPRNALIEEIVIAKEVTEGHFKLHGMVYPISQEAVYHQVDIKVVAPRH